jgi:hypothetical protein
MQVSRIIFILITFVVIESCTKDRAGQTNLIPNGDFENWTAAPRLTDLKTNNCPECDPPFETYIVQKDSSAYHGRYAAKFIYNNVYAAWIEIKFPLYTHPLFLGGYVKCHLNGTDTVSVKIRLFKNTAVVDSGEWLGTSSITQYQHMGIPITQHSAQVDSALIRITGGQTRNSGGKNTEFWIDYLTLE